MSKHTKSKHVMSKHTEDIEDGLYMAADNNNEPSISQRQKNHTVIVFLCVIVISIFIGFIISFVIIEGGCVSDK